MYPPALVLCVACVTATVMQSANSVAVQTVMHVDSILRAAVRNDDCNLTAWSRVILRSGRGVERNFRSQKSRKIKCPKSEEFFENNYCKGKVSTFGAMVHGTRTQGQSHCARSHCTVAHTGRGGTAAATCHHMPKGCRSMKTRRF